MNNAPNFFYVVLSICMAVLTAGFIVHRFRNLFRRRPDMDRSDLIDRISELESELYHLQQEQHRGLMTYHSGVTELINAYMSKHGYDGNNTTKIDDLITLANSFPDIKKWGEIGFTSPGKKTVGLILK